MKIYIIDAIISINPNAVVSVLNDDINKIEWLNGTTSINKQTILNKQTELQNAEDNRVVQEQENKQSAISKLKALGLNDAEINAILGL